MELSKIYRDVYSRLNLKGDKHSVYFLDVVNAINQSIKEIRLQYISNGFGHFFTTSETVDTFTEDPNFSFLNKGTLSNIVFSTVPLSVAVTASNIKINSEELLDQAQTFSEGDIVNYEDKLYEAVTDISNENTFGKVFDSKNLRSFYPDNGLKYKEDEIVYNTDDDLIYRVTQDFIATGGDNFTEQVFWRYIGPIHKFANVYEFDELRSIILHNNTVQSFTINNNEVYVNPKVSELNITYIPEWTDVTDMSADLPIPEMMVSDVVNQATNKLLRKLARAETPEPEPEEDDQ